VKNAFKHIVKETNSLAGNEGFTGNSLQRCLTRNFSTVTVFVNHVIQGYNKFILFCDTLIVNCG